MENRTYAWVSSPFPLEDVMSDFGKVEVFHTNMPIRAIEEKPQPTVYLPFTRVTADTLFFGEGAISTPGIFELEKFLAAANIKLQLVKMTDQDATDFRGYFQWYINYLNITLYTPETILRNTSGIWKEHLKRLGAGI